MQVSWRLEIKLTGKVPVVEQGPCDGVHGSPTLYHYPFWALCSVLGLLALSQPPFHLKPSFPIRKDIMCLTEPSLASSVVHPSPLFSYSFDIVFAKQCVYLENIKKMTLQTTLGTAGQNCLVQIVGMYNRS